jgi:hypothetical protein
MATRIGRHDVCFYIVVIVFLGSTQGFLLASPLSLVGRKSRLTPPRTLPEHLIDCAANPVLADLYGGSGSAYCMQGSMGPLSGLGSVVEQALTIGFLVSAYFFFKRSQGGIIDWNETTVDDWEIEEEDEDEGGEFAVGDKEFTEAFDRMQKRRRSSSKQCPQCGGSGRFSWTAASSATRCNLCEGLGVISSPSSITSGMRGSRRALPPIVDTNLELEDLDANDGRSPV